MGGQLYTPAGLAPNTLCPSFEWCVKSEFVLHTQLRLQYKKSIILHIRTTTNNFDVQVTMQRDIFL